MEHLVRYLRKKYNKIKLTKKEASKELGVKVECDMHIQEIAMRITSEYERGVAI